MISAMFSKVKQALQFPVPHSDGFDALQRWIEANRPDLDAELSSLSLDQVRERLNAMTGLEVLSCESIHTSGERFLEALKAQQ